MGFSVPVIFRSYSKKASAPAGPVTLIYDTFTDTDGTELTSHTIAPTNTPATSWTKTVVLADLGIPKINSNKVSGAHGGAVVDVGEADVKITFDWTIGSDYWSFWTFRYEDINNWLRIHEEKGSGFIKLYKCVSGTITQVAYVTFTRGAGTYQVTITLSGNSITYQVGTEVHFNAVTISDNATLTKHGIAVLNVGSFSVDNYKIETLP